jgi:hypothetical protein
MPRRYIVIVIVLTLCQSGWRGHFAQAAPGCGTGHTGVECDQMLQQQRNQRMEDARAMFQDNLNRHSNLIKTIEISYKCNLTDEASTQAAMIHAEGAMFDERLQAGLLDDRTISVRDFTLRGIDAGKHAVEEGACTRMTPAERGRLRALVGSLVR